MHNDGKDFLDKLDDELESMSSNTIKKVEANIAKRKEENRKKNNNWDVVITSFSNKKNDSSNSIIKDNKEEVVKPKRIYTKNSKTDKFNRREKFVSKFPETRFYLPSLRDKHTRYIPIGWNDETGSKNMWMFQYGDDIILVDCGVMFADETLPGVDYSIPDISFLTKYTKQIKGFLITHAHLDHIGALKHIVPALDFPVLYWTKLTIWIVKKGLEEAWVLDKCTFIEINAKEENKTKLWGFTVEFFSINHSIPDSAGLFIESEGWAKFFHTWDFKIDLTPAVDQPADLDRFERFWKKWVTMLLSDSTWSLRKGHTKSEKDVWEALDKIVGEHNSGRLIIATFSSWISRVQQLIDSCEKYDKTIFLSGRSMVENIDIAKELGYLKMKSWTMKKMTPKNTEWIPANKQVIITTWSQWEEFSSLTRMAWGLHNSIEIISWDTVVFSSSVVPGNDRSVIWVINKLIKLWAKVITKDNLDVHTGWHAFVDEQKKMLELVQPKYFTPIYWDVYFRDVHAQTAMETWVKKDNILLLGNGNIVDFTPEGRVFRSKIKVPLQDIIIDGNGMW